MDHYYENFEEKVKNKALNEKLKFGTNCNAFLDLFYITYVKIGFGDMIPLKDHAIMMIALIYRIFTAESKNNIVILWFPNLN